MTNIETPDGWQPSGPCFTREYNGRYAVIAKPQGKIWNARVYRPERFDGEWLDSLPEAVAWANEHLGVPKPVEFVEEKFSDGSRVIKDAANTRWATVMLCRGRWWVAGNCVSLTNQQFDDEAIATKAARAYVRGDA